jgi:hypothetical protein
LAMAVIGGPSSIVATVMGYPETEESLYVL